MTRSLMISTALAVSVCGMAWADDPSPSPSPSPGLSEYVEVTATRIPEPAEGVPAGIEVVSGTEQQDRNARDLPSALALATGVEVAPGGDNGPAGSVPEFWGLKEFDAFLLVVDGVPWGGAFNPALTTLDLENTERIEVLRGAAPVMYGATSFVGVLHVVHNAPGEGPRTLRLGGGSYSTFNGALATSLPDWAGWKSSLSGSYDNQGFKDPHTGFERGQVLWRNAHPWGAGRVWFDASGTIVNQDPASPHLRIGPTLTPLVPLDANYNPEGAFLNNKRGGITAGFERPLASASWSTTASFAHTNQDIFRGFLSDVTEPGDNAHGLREKIELNDLYFDSHLAWLTRKDLRIVGGVDYLHGEGDATGADFDYHVDLSGRTQTHVAEPSVLDVGIDDKRDFGGAYTFAEWNPTLALRLEAGVRLNITHEERGGGEDEAAKKAAGQQETDQGVNNTRLSGSAGLTWTAWRRGENAVRLYADYRDTFKPAAVDFGIGEGELDPDKAGVLKPETSRSYEIGIRGRGFDGRAGAEVTTFLMDFSNLVVPATVNGLPALINAGTQRFKGVEASLWARLAPSLRARASYSWHDARFRDFVADFDGVLMQLGGNRLEMSPRSLASAGLLYAPARGVIGLVELGYVGSQYLDKRNRALADGYATLTAGLGYRSEHWELRVDGRNLTDRRDPVSESELGDAQYYRLPARRIDVTASLRF
jgi:iron complex outermembrane receptor protein